MNGSIVSIESYISIDFVIIKLKVKGKKLMVY